MVDAALRPRRDAARRVPAAHPGVVAGVRPRRPARARWHVFGPSWLAVLVGVYSLGAHTEEGAGTSCAAVLGVVFVLMLIAGVLDDEVTLVDAIANVFYLGLGDTFGLKKSQSIAHTEPDGQQS